MTRVRYHREFCQEREYNVLLSGRVVVSLNC
jgi:hypothetical protein